MVRVNALLLQNFLDATKLASITPKRFMLQTGAKNYGGHLGPTKVPQEETDPRIELAPNFYYAQEDVLFGYYETGCKWNIIMSEPIIGAVPDAAMNAAFPLAVVAMTADMSSAMLNACMEEWAVLLGPPNEKFNAADGSAFAWGKAWPNMAELYGLDWLGPRDSDKYTKSESAFNPRGYGPKAISRRKFRLSEWARKDEVRQAWCELAQDHDLKPADPEWTDDMFTFTDSVLCRTAPLHFSLNKARKLGWFGFVDSKDCYLETFKAFASLKMIPPVPNT